MLKSILRMKNVNTLFRHSCASINNTKSVDSRLVSTGKVKLVKTFEEPEEQTVKKHANPFAVEKPTHLQQTQPELSDEEQERRLKVLQLEVDIAHQEGRRVPPLEFFQQHHWEEILTLPTKSARAKYYAYLWQISMKKDSRERRKLEKREIAQERMAEVRKERAENDHIVYGLGHTSMFLRIYDATITHWQNHRLIRAMQFAPKVVLDCSYDRHMNKREASNAGKQLMLSFAENRAHDDPFDLHYCNVNLEDNSMKTLKRFIPTMLNPEFPMNIHEKSFTEVFPKEQLVYLTPHCRNDLEAYNPDDVYIIGAMVDTVNNEPLSLAKAKRLGLRMARLPLDRYLQWGSGSGKSLTLNQMVHILLDLKQTGNWEKALAHVPRRKVLDIEAGNLYERKTLDRRAKKLNVRIDSVMNHEDEEIQDKWRNKAKQNQQKTRSYKENIEFKLDTWGARKKTKNIQ